MSNIGPFPAQMPTIAKSFIQNILHSQLTDKTEDKQPSSI